MFSAVGILGGKSLLVSSSTSICTYDIRVMASANKFGNASCIFQGASSIQFLTVDTNHSTLYFADNVQRAIIQYDLVYMTNQTWVYTGNVSGNIYLEIAGNSLSYSMWFSSWSKSKYTFKKENTQHITKHVFYKTAAKLLSRSVWMMNGT